MRLTILTLCLLLALGGNAQQLLSLDESRQMALDYNKSLQSANLRWQEAQSQQKEARTAYLPNIDGSASATYMPGMDNIDIPGFHLPTADSDGTITGESNVYFPGMSLETEDLTIYQAQVGMKIPIYAGGQIRYANKMADKGVEMAGQAYQLESDQVIFNTDQAYWRLVAFKENLIVARKYVEMLDSLEAQLKDMYDLGLTPKSEQLKVTVQKNQAQLNLLRAENGFKILKMNLCQLIGLDLQTTIEVSDQLNTQPDLPIMAEGIQLAMGNRNELKMLSGQVAIADYQRKSISGAYMPSLGAQVSYGYNEVANLMDGQWNTTAAAQLSIPLVHWREKKHKVNVAKLQKQQAELKLEESKEFVQLEVQQYMIQVGEAYEAILLAQKSKIEAEESLEEVTASFEVGLNTTTDLLNAQAAWQNAHASLLEALAKFEISKTAYYKGIGELANQ
ncbi:MAG: TolC family protein [Marinilabiliaceae bacterium]|nr:TolC family protein [Marinilabiliaceae bacterium]